MTTSISPWRSICHLLCGQKHAMTPLHDVSYQHLHYSYLQQRKQNFNHSGILSNRWSLFKQTDFDQFNYINKPYTFSACNQQKIAFTLYIQTLIHIESITTLFSLFIKNKNYRKIAKTK